MGPHRRPQHHFVALDGAGQDIDIVRRNEHGPEIGW